MDYASCNVVYVDRTASEDRLVKRSDAAALHAEKVHHVEGGSSARRHGSVVEENMRTLLGIFSEVHICTSGKSCISTLYNLNATSMADLIPTILLIDIPYEDQLSERTPRDSSPSPGNIAQINVHQEDNGAYGLRLLQWIASEIQYQSLSKLVVPVAVCGIHNGVDPLTLGLRGRGDTKPDRGLLTADPFIPTSRASPGHKPQDNVRSVKFLDLGAADVLTSPFLQDRLPSLAIHAYRAHKEASKEERAMIETKRNRKRSWVGLDEQKPYAYLREAMVSGLMDGICRLEGEAGTFGHPAIPVDFDRRERIEQAISSWEFSAHDFSDDELVHAASLMFQHALTMPDLESWRISAENITAFLVASRSAYNAFVPYHNFRHVVDVLQATFHFLVRLGRLPKYPSQGGTSIEDTSPIAALIRPFDALTLLITAVGHDVGHPGVNNAFLVTLNAPLAQLYNDRSVLESFHCAAYSQILRRHWPAAFHGVEMRKLMINSILATDMGLHFDYMKRLGFLQEKLHEEGGTYGWNGRTVEENRTLACSLLIKCADISNVARKSRIAAQWIDILTDEFARQDVMEKDLGIPSTLFAPPVREVIELGKSQLGFMNMFAIPLFQGVTDIMPGIGFCVDELLRNKSAWEEQIAQEQRKMKEARQQSTKSDITASPRTLSPATVSGGKNDMSSPKPSNNLRMQAIFNQSPVREANGWSTSSKDPSTDSYQNSSPHPGSGDSEGSSPSMISPTSLGPRSAKPSQLNFDFPGSANNEDHQDFAYANNSPEALTNGLKITPLSSTTPTLTDYSPTRPHKHPNTPKQRSSDTTTEGSSSAVGDWNSTATSATTSRMPLSPSTQATSITSQDQDCDPHMHNHNSSLSQSLRPCTSPSTFRTGNGDTGPRTPDREEHEARGRGSEISPNGKESSSGMMGTVRSLRKKPSRFRMNNIGLHFWKRSKSASPPMPVGGNFHTTDRNAAATRSEGDAGMEC